MAHKLYTEVMNSEPARTLSFAGPRVEMVIPNGTPITVHETKPSPTVVDDGNLVGRHYTKSADQILSSGFAFPPNDSHEFTNEVYEDTIRYKAGFAWPHTKDATGAHISYNDRESVYLEVPRDQIAISTYRFLDLLSFDPESPGTDFEIPIDHYDESLTFSPVALYNAIDQYSRPFRSYDQLLWSDYWSL